MNPTDLNSVKIRDNFSCGDISKNFYVSEGREKIPLKTYHIKLQR